MGLGVIPCDRKKSGHIFVLVLVLFLTAPLSKPTTTIESSLFFWLPLVVLIILYCTIARKLTAKGPPNKHAGNTVLNNPQNKYV
jgi:hypothetical protein